MGEKAWRVDVRGWPEAQSVVAGATRSQARYRVWAAANEAGFRLDFGEINPRRAPEYDGLAGKVPTTEKFIQEADDAS